MKTAYYGVGSSRKTIKTSISLDGEMFQLSKLVARQSGFPFSYSAYVASLIQKDLACRLEQKKPQLV